MIEPNRTYSNQPHRILISSPKPTTDRTGLYILLLLLSLLLILMFYLVYNFIAYKRYRYSQKKKTNFENQLNDRLLILLDQSNQQQQQPIKTVYNYEELVIPSDQMATTLSEYQNFKQMNKSISNQYHITNHLVSDL